MLLKLHLSSSPPSPTTRRLYPVDAYEDPPSLTTTQEHPPTPTFNPSPNLSPSYPPVSLLSPPITSPWSILSTSASQSHPPSPVHVAKKRLSFMSYSNLLSSTPQSTHPLFAHNVCIFNRAAASRPLRQRFEHCTCYPGSNATAWLSAPPATTCKQ